MRPEDLKGRDAWAFSRVSTVKQEEGFGFDRQERIRDAVVAWLGLNLVDARQYIGSGWKGAHKREGALLELIELGQTGKIPPGTPLLIESIDRLSREPLLDGLDTLKSLVRSRWVIVTCEDRQIYDLKALNGPLAHVIVAKLQQANGESNRKSDVVGDAWEAKKEAAEAGVPLTRHCPGWLRLVPKGNYPSNAPPEDCIYVEQDVQVDTIKRIFELARTGIGRDRIAAILNREGWPPIGSAVESVRPDDHAWRGTRIGFILRDQRVRGLLTLKRRDGSRVTVRLYPQVIGDDVWVAARAAVEARQKQTGAKGRDYANLFVKLARCHCGASLVVRSGGRMRGQAIVRRTTRNRHYWNVLMCSNAVEGRGCEHRTRYRLRDWERLLLDTVTLSPPPMKDAAHSDELRNAEKAVASLDIEIDLAQRSIGFLAGRAESSPTARAAYDEQEKKVDSLRRQHRRASARFEELRFNEHGSANARQQIHELIVAATDDRNIEAREKIRTLLPLVVKEIKPTKRGGLGVWFHDGQVMTFDERGWPDDVQTKPIGQAEWDVLKDGPPLGWVGWHSPMRSRLRSRRL